jgi:hypothetical protein
MFLGMNNLSHLTQPPLNNQTLEERKRRDREEEKIIRMIYFSVSDLYQHIVKGCDSVRRDGYRLYNEVTKCMISSCDVVFHENIFKVSNEYTTIATPPYVGSDTVFVDNSTTLKTTWPTGHHQVEVHYNQCEEEAIQYRICSE